MRHSPSCRVARAIFNTRSLGWGAFPSFLLAVALLFIFIGQAHAQGISTCPPGPTYDRESPSAPGARVCVPRGNSAFATSVFRFEPGTYTLNTDCPNTGQKFPPLTKANNQNGTASGALGIPDVPVADFSTPSVRVKGSTSLGGLGRLTLRFDAPLTGDGNSSTPDLWVWQVGQQGADTFKVEVSADGNTWTLVGSTTAPSIGSQGFDIDHAGFGRTARLSFIRITDTGNQTGGCQAGSDIDAVAVLSAIVPAISLTKTASPSSGVKAGDVITYSYSVTNTGTDPLLNLHISDSLPGVSAVVCPMTTLAIGQSTICSATYTVTAAGVTAGRVTNSATATADAQAGGTVTATSGAVVPAAQPVQISLTKTASPGAVNAGGLITFTYVITNSSVATILNNVILTDALPGVGPITCVGVTLPTTLSVGQSITCHATYTATAVDATNGRVTNNATATGTPPSGPSVSAGSTATVLVLVPKISVTKTASPNSGVQAGSVITYTLQVANSGTDILTNVPRHR